MKKSEQSIQTMWEIWFVASVIIFLAYFFVGTLENSITFLPNWPYFFGLSIINLVICLYQGFKKPKES